MMSKVDPAAAAFTINEWLTVFVVTSNQGLKLLFTNSVTSEPETIIKTYSQFLHLILCVAKMYSMLTQHEAGSGCTFLWHKNNRFWHIYFVFQWKAASQLGTAHLTVKCVMRIHCNQKLWWENQNKNNVPEQLRHLTFNKGLLQR